MADPMADLQPRTMLAATVGLLALAVGCDGTSRSDVPDTGGRDAGMSSDAAVVPDAGPEDAGVSEDTGVAGEDVGVTPDAGPFEPIVAPLAHRFGGANHHRIYTQLELEPVDGVERSAEAQINAMRRAGLKVLRLFLHQEDSVPWEIPSVSFTFEDPIGTFQTRELEWIDRLMTFLVGDVDDPFDDVRLIISFFNPLKGTPLGDVQEDLYFEAFGEIGFYTSPAAIEAFKNRISHVMNHRNPYLGGKAWKDLDIVVGWEPMNEPGLHTAGDARQTTTATIASWLATMAEHIKSIDDDGTLVLSGTAGHSGYENLEVGDNLPALMAQGGIEGIDVYTIHFYGTDPTARIADAKAALPSGAQVWVTEFGDTRDPVNPLTFDASPDGVLGRIEAQDVPWSFWRMGIRSEVNTFSRFEGDADWSALSDVARSKTSSIALFDGEIAETVTRNDGRPLDAELAPSDRGGALSWVMGGGYQELKVRFTENYDLRGGAVTFRARASTPMSVEIQVKDESGGFSQGNPFVELTPAWQYYQLPLDRFDTTSMNPALFREIVFWFKDGSDQGRSFLLDDLWVW